MLGQIVAILWANDKWRHYIVIEKMTSVNGYKVQKEAIVEWSQGVPNRNISGVGPDLMYSISAMRPNN